MCQDNDWWFFPISLETINMDHGSFSPFQPSSQTKETPTKLAQWFSYLSNQLLIQFVQKSSAQQLSCLACALEGITPCQKWNHGCYFLTDGIYFANRKAVCFEMVWSSKSQTPGWFSFDNTEHPTQQKLSNAPNFNDNGIARKVVPNGGTQRSQAMVPPTQITDFLFWWVKLQEHGITVQRIKTELQQTRHHVFLQLYNPPPLKKKKTPRERTPKNQAFFEQNIWTIQPPFFGFPCQFSKVYIPRHPDTWWVGVWTPKHLLRRPLKVPNTYSPGIWRILDV